MKTAIETLLPVVTPLLFSALAAGTAWVLLHVGSWLKAKAQNSKALGAINVFYDLAVSVVQDIEANEKKQMAADGGKFDGAKLKALALERIKSVMGPEGLAALQKALGILAGGRLDAYLSGTVERALVAVKQPGLVGSPK